MTSKRRVYASFTTDEILRESGRLPFAVLTPFVRSGYEVLLDASLGSRLSAFYGRSEAELPEPARLSLTMPGVELTTTIPDEPGEFVLLCDEPQDPLRDLPWNRLLRIRFDLFSPYWLTEPVIAPYAMHPAQSLRATPDLLQALRVVPRSLRLLFAGDSKGYSRNRVRFPRPKLPRLEILALLREHLGTALTEVAGAHEIDRLCAGGFVGRFVLSDSGSGIGPAQWLPTVARADFFLCAPGIVMPMCHNVIEAMAVGTIPLIGYPEWFCPRLEHLRNCITFDDRDDLMTKVKLVLEMPSEQIARLRGEVIDYYERHLRPETLVRSIEARSERDLTVLIYTEFNMARYADRLGPRSVLMRGPDSGGPLRRVGRLLDRISGRA